MHGVTAYPTLRDLPEPPELVILAMPAAALDEVLDDALAAGARAFIGIFAGLGESGPDGMARERAAALRIRRAGRPAPGAQLHGPRGPYDGLRGRRLSRCARPATSASSRRAAPWVRRWSAAPWPTVAASRVTSPSAIRRTSASPTWWAASSAMGRRVPWRSTPRASSDGRALAAAMAAVVRGGTPVVLLSPGRSAASVRAARSHTGSLAPGPAVVDAVCRAAGVRCAWTRRASSSRSPWRWPPRRPLEGAASRW